MPRTLRRLLLAAALGLVATLALAMGSAAVFPSRMNLNAVGLDFLTEAADIGAGGHDELHRHPPPPKSWLLYHPLGPPRSGPSLPCPAVVERVPGGQVVYGTCGDFTDQVSLLAYAYGATSTAGRRVTYRPWMSHYHDARGWPMHALGIPWDRATAAPVIGDGKAFPRIRIPLHPMWPGLLGDTAIFTTAWSVPLVIAPAVRRRRRERSGRCTACGYDLAGLAICPECGRGGEA